MPNRPLRFIKICVAQWVARGDGNTTFTLFALTDEGLVFKWSEGNQGWIGLGEEIVMKAEKRERRANRPPMAAPWGHEDDD